MTGNKCPICEKDAATQLAEEDMYRVDCGSCGKYLIAGLEELNTHKMSPEDKARLRAVVRERCIGGLPVLIVAQRPKACAAGGVTIADLLGEYPKTATEMIDRAMLNLGRLARHPCDQIELEFTDYPVLFGRDPDDMEQMFVRLRSMDYVTDAGTTADAIRLTISTAGWRKIEELQLSNLESKQGFVAMWFDQQMQTFWEEGFRPGIEQAGEFTAVRIDLQEHNEKICDRIIAEIRRSRFVVADFTGNREGVYYEAGFAQGLGIPVIWTVREDWLGKVHFDTRQYNHIHYDTSEELRKALKNRITATIPGAMGKQGPR